MSGPKKRIGKDNNDYTNMKESNYFNHIYLGTFLGTTFCRIYLQNMSGPKKENWNG